MALERCAEVVRADVADQRWESARQGHGGDNTPKAMQGRDPHADTAGNGEGKQSGEIMPVAAV